MIDFKKESAKFDFLTLDPEPTGHYNETVQLIEVFNSTLRRIGKEVNNANIQLEEILVQSMEEKEKNRYIAEQREL